MKSHDGDVRSRVVVGIDVQPELNVLAWSSEGSFWNLFERFLMDSLRRDRREAELLQPHSALWEPHGDFQFTAHGFHHLLDRAGSVVEPTGRFSL